MAAAALWRPRTWGCRRRDSRAGEATQGAEVRPAEGRDDVSAAQVKRAPHTEERPAANALRTLCLWVGVSGRVCVWVGGARAQPGRALRRVVLAASG